jgi:hypothetical protein
MEAVEWTNLCPIFAFEQRAVWSADPTHTALGGRSHGLRLLPREPAELELSIIELEDGSGSLSMRMRDSAVGSPDATDISDVGDWRAYCTQTGIRFEGNRA